MSEDQPTLPGLNTPLEKDEPVFVLRARDPLAPHLAALWASLRKGDTASAIMIFADTVADPAHAYRLNNLAIEATIKVDSASNKAVEMNNWRHRNSLPTFNLHTV